MQYSFSLLILLCPLAMALKCPALKKEAETAEAIIEASNTIATKFAKVNEIFLKPDESKKAKEYGKGLLKGQKLGSKVEVSDAVGALKYALKNFVSCFETNDLKIYTAAGLENKDEIIKIFFERLPGPQQTVLAAVGSIFRSISAKENLDQENINKLLETLCSILIKQDSGTLEHWGSKKASWSSFLEEFLDYFHRDAMVEALDWIKNHTEFQGIFRISGSFQIIVPKGDGLMMGKSIAYNTYKEEEIVPIVTGAVKHALGKIFAGWITTEQVIKYSELTEQKAKHEFITGLISRLSRTRKEEFKKVAEMVDAIVANHETNKMDFNNLVIVLSPNFIESPLSIDKNLLEKHTKNSSILLQDLFKYVKNN